MIALAAMHAALFVIAPMLSVRVLTCGPVAIMLGMPLAVIGHGLRDVAQERWGARVSREFVVAAVIVRAVCWPLLLVAGQREAFRIALAGELHLLVAQYLIAPRVFTWARGFSRFPGAYLLTQVVTEVASVAVFVAAANLGTNRPILSVIVGGLLMRWILSLGLAPVLAGLVRWLPVALLLAATPASALDLGPLKLDGWARYLRDDDLRTTRYEGFVGMKLGRLWLTDLYTYDELAVGKVTFARQNRGTLGVSIAWGFSLVAQQQRATRQPTYARYGIEWRLP